MIPLGVLASSRVASTIPLQYNSDISIDTGKLSISGARAIPTVFFPVTPGVWYEYRRNGPLSGNSGSRLYGPSYEYISGNSVIRGDIIGQGDIGQWGWYAGFVQGRNWSAYRFQVPSGVAFFKFIDEANTNLLSVTIVEV